MLELGDKSEEGSSLMSRTLFTRANQHFKVGDKREEASSWLWDHTKEFHGGTISVEPRGDYRFRLVGMFRDRLTRQLEKAVRLMDSDQIR